MGFASMLRFGWTNVVKRVCLGELIDVGCCHNVLQGDTGIDCFLNGCVRRRLKDVRWL